jgi:ABC-2 type transport system ATP-binding protein
MTWGLDAVSVSYRRRPALASVTIPAEPGQITVVVGGDGAGKSTALRTLVGLARPGNGVVRRPSKTQIGYVPATAGLYPDLTVRENLAFAASAYGISGDERDRRISEVADRVGLAEATHRLGGQLSGGMQRKLAVGMALVHSPELLVLDEPTTGVDPVSRTELWRLIARAAASGAAVVVATTYVSEAERGTDAVLLEAGEVLASGSADDIVKRMPGTLGTMPGGTQPTQLSWRRGVNWRVWAPTGNLPKTASPVAPDIEDAAVVAELAAETNGA